MSANLPSTAVPEFKAAVPPHLRADFPTEDDTPVDNLYSEKQQRLFTEPLFSSWSGPNGNRGFVVMANVGLFYSDIKPPIVPDGLLSVGVKAPADMWPRENRSYFIRKYGKSPEVVIETVSNLEGKEFDEKLLIYAQAKVPYYVVWDPENQLGRGRLTAFRLKSEVYERLHELWFEEVGLGLAIWHGSFEGNEADWLRWVDRNGVVIATGAEASEREKARAEQDKLRAEQEKQRAEQQKLRADRLAAQLRALGIDPESSA